MNIVGSLRKLTLFCAKIFLRLHNNWAINTKKEIIFVVVSICSDNPISDRMSVSVGPLISWSQRTAPKSGSRDLINIWSKYFFTDFVSDQVRLTDVTDLFSNFSWCFFMIFLLFRYFFRPSCDVWHKAKASNPGPTSSSNHN